MATINLTESQKAQIDGQNSAVDNWPSDMAARQHLFQGYLEAKKQEAAELKRAQDEAKKKINVAGKLETLTKEYGWEKKALDVIMSLKKITDLEKMARTARQIYEGMRDQGMLIPELFDPDRMGLHEGKADEADDKPVFDNTPKGSQTAGLGGAAQEKPETFTSKPTPAVDLRVAQATLELNNFKTANTGKLKAAQKKELAALEAKVAEAEALALSDPGGDKAKVIETPPSLDIPAEIPGTAETDLPDVNPNPPTDAELPELPAAETGTVSKEIAAGTAESTAHIETQTAAELPVKPKRLGGSARKKLAEQKAAEKASQEAATKEADSPISGPDGPDDDDTGSEAPFAPLPPSTRGKPAPLGGTASASTRLG